MLEVLISGFLLFLFIRFLYAKLVFILLQNIFRLDLGRRRKISHFLLLIMYMRKKVGENECNANDSLLPLSLISLMYFLFLSPITVGI